MARWLSFSFASSLVIQLVNILTGVLLARCLGPTDRGTLVMILIVPTIVATVGAMGLTHSSVVFGASGEVAPERLIGTLSVLGLALSIPLMMASGALALLLLRNQSGDPKALGIVYALLIPLNLLTLFSQGALSGWGHPGWVSMVRAMVIVVNATILIAAFALGTITLEIAVFASLFANLTTCLLAWLAAFRIAGNRPIADPRLARELLRFGLSTHPGNVAALINERGDQFVMAFVLSSAQLGLYAVAATLSSAPMLAATSIAIAATPLVRASRKTVSERQIVLQLMPMSSLLCILLAIPVVLLASPLIRILFGASFVEASTATRVLAIAGSFLGICIVQRALLIGLGKGKASSKAELLSLCATLLGLLLLLKPFGIVGAAMASLIAYLLSCTWMSRQLIDSLNMSWTEFFIPNRKTFYRLLTTLASMRRNAGSMRTNTADCAPEDVAPLSEPI